MKKTGRFLLPHNALLGSALALFLLLLAGPLQGQPVTPSDNCLGGNLYYVAFPDTVNNTQDPRFPDGKEGNFLLMIYSDVDQDVEFTRAGGASTFLKVEGGSLAQFDPSSFHPLQNTTTNRVHQSPLKVEADYPIVLYAYYSTPFGTAGFTPLPVSDWGKEYFAATWPGGVVRNIYPAGETNYDATEKKAAPAEILVIASEENTTVTFGPTGEIAGGRRVLTVLLDAGESYQIASTVDTGAREGDVAYVDIAGTLITADKPIGVISANTRTRIEEFPFPMLAGNSVKDLMAEWLTPTSMHGSEFAYIPEQDDRRQRGISEHERVAENVRIFATTGETGVKGSSPSGGRIDLVDRPIGPTKFVNWRVEELRIGRVIETTRPAQAFRAVNGVAKFNGTTGSGNFIGASFSSWGTSMVGLVPRERWGSFAPFRAPTTEVNMRHYVTVVTDSNDRFDIYLQQENQPPTLVLFPHAIEGSDLVWGTMVINPGLSYRLTGREGARFSGHISGSQEGFELYRPGSARRDEKGTGASALHPSEYEESVAAAYAMPLASTSCTDDPPNRYRIDTLKNDCFGLTLRITAEDGSPLNLRFIRLVGAETENTRFELMAPRDFDRLDTARAVILRLAPIDPSMPAEALLEFRDRTREGELVQTRYSSIRPILGSDPFTTEFLEAKTTVERSMLLYNDKEYPIDLRSISLREGDQGFSIVRTDPRIPWDNVSQDTRLFPGDSLWVFVRYNPTGQKESRDALIVDLICGLMIFPLNGSDDPGPCLQVSDLDFGVLPLGVSKTLSLEMCNLGGGALTFTSGPGGEVLEWIVKEFTVAQRDIDRLANITLGPGDCVTIDVTFKSSEVVGEFRTVARFYTNPEGCRDSSVWIARVGTSSVRGAEETKGLRITSLAPNPGDGLIHLRYQNLIGDDDQIALVDARGVQRAVPIVREQQGTEQSVLIDGTVLPSGLYYITIRSGDEVLVRPVTIVR